MLGVTKGRGPPFPSGLKVPMPSPRPLSAAVRPAPRTCAGVGATELPQPPPTTGGTVPPTGCLSARVPNRIQSY